jgi:hypothetical protein
MSPEAQFVRFPQHSTEHQAIQVLYLCSHIQRTVAGNKVSFVFKLLFISRMDTEWTEG